MTRECAQCSPYGTRLASATMLLCCGLYPLALAPLDFWIISTETLDEKVGE